MPYSSNTDLPASVRNALPSEAQTTFRTVVNNALVQYDGDESRAFATAWAALRRAGWSKDEDGNWIRKAEGFAPLETVRNNVVQEVKKLTERDFIIKNVDQRYTLGIVYEPNIVDTQGDFSDESEIEKACWNFMRKLQGQGQLTKAALTILEHITKAAEDGETIRLDVTDALDTIEKRGLNDMHVNTPWDEDLGEIVECYCAPVDFELNGEKVTKGTWLMGVVWSQDHFAKVASGERTGYSMEGKGRRVKVDA